MEEKLNAVSKFSSGDCDCSYDVICSFLVDCTFLILPSEHLSDISNERNLSEQTESDVSSNEDTNLIQRSTENYPRISEGTARTEEKRPKILEIPTSNRNTTCDVFVIRNIKNSKHNELRWLEDDPSTSSSLLEMGFEVMKKPGFEKKIHILIRKKKGCDKQPLQVNFEIMSHSKPPTPFVRNFEIVDEITKIITFRYSFITFQSKEKKFLDKNGNVVVQCTVEKPLCTVSDFRCTLIFLIFIVLLCISVSILV